MSDLDTQADATATASGPDARSGRNWSSWGSRLGVPVVLLFAGAAVALIGERLVAHGGDAQETRVLTMQDWRLVCGPAIQTPPPAAAPGQPAPPPPPPQPRCTLTQEVARQEGGVLVVLQLNDAQRGSNMVVMVPHGVAIEPGLGLRVGTGEPTVRPYETCSPLGCIAHVPMDEQTVEAMRRNQEGQIIIVPANAGGGGQPTSIPFSLRGFAEAYARLARETGTGSVFGFGG